MTSVIARDPLTERFSGEAPVSMAQGRHGELIIAQGGGVRPARWIGEGEAVDAGMDAPATAPQVNAIGPAEYYVARVDVTNPGACYYAPPAVTFSESSGIALAGPAGRGATAPTPPSAAAYLSQASVSEVQVINGGKRHRSPLTVELSDTHGKGAIIEAILDEPADDPLNSRKTGITTWEVVSGGDGSTFAGGFGVPFTIIVDGNGVFRLRAGPWFRTSGPSGYTCTFWGPTNVSGFTTDLVGTAAGWTSGTGAAVRLEFTGNRLLHVCQGVNFWTGATSFTHEVARYGHGYSDEDTIVLTLFPLTGGAPIILHGMTRGNPNNTGGPRYRVKALKLIDGGSGYLVAPQLKIVSQTGFGAFATCKVKDGKITEVILENGGGGYASPPTVEVLSGGAEAFAISRPHLRGKYQCYYRYVDATPEDSGGPIPSNLSPVAEVDAGEGKRQLSWGVQPPSGRAYKVELWRTTSNQATTLYRVASIWSGPFYDDLTDEELRDPNRNGYAAMPIVLPNGEVNANRFGIPPSDKAVVVRFQDRMWYGVDTSGKQPNTIYYSETDEPESVPDTNEIVLQQNARDADRLQAMIPFGSVLLLMQERRSYSLTFAKTPILDAQVTPLAYRGCLNQRCWDIYGGVCYVLDQYGIYGIQPTGQLESLSDAIDNLFRTEIDFSKSTWSFVLVDAATKTLRAFVAFKEDNSAGYPTGVLCYSLETKAWWVEKYPQRVSGGTQVRLSNGDFRCVYAGQTGPLLLNDGHADLGRGSVVSVSLTNAGTGYRTPPAVTAAGGCGATFQASITKQGSISAIWITSPGYGYSGGSLFIEPPNDPNVQNPQQAAAVFTATPLSSDTPLHPTYRFKGGAAEYVTEAQDPRAASDSPRTITLHYEPQPQSSEVSLRTYYNNSPSPRPNVAPRNRGAGFSHSTVDNAARYDLAAATATTGADTGIASAMFTGRTLADIQSGDKYVAVELVGARKSAHPLTFYGIDIAGAAGK